MNSLSSSSFRKALSWLIHGFTASGLVAAFLAILAINERDWRLAMIWLIVAAVIDGVDGTFARYVKVKEVLPKMNGAMIDAIVDFVNYAVVPAYLLYSADVFPGQLNLLLIAIILIVSAMYYGKEGMVSEDMYFIGFPVLWNVVAFFILFVFPPNLYFNAFVVFLCAILHFIPLKFAYPSRKSEFQKVNLLFSILFLFTMLAMVYQFPDRSLVLVVIAYVCASYFILMAIYNTYIR